MIPKNMKEAFALPQLDNDQIIELIKVAQAGGENAKIKIIESNYRLVYHYAKQFKNATNRITVIDMDDLINEGVIGLITAIDKFDLTMNVKFSYYAVYHIKKEMLATIMNDANLIRIPINKQTAMKKIGKKIDKLLQENEGYLPSNIEDDQFKKKYFDYYFNQFNYTHLDDEMETLELFELPKEEEDFIRLRKAINKLKPVYKEIILHLFGIDGYEKMNQTEIAKHLKRSKQRINEIVKLSLATLKDLMK
jgi:RNA polymerase sigma factor (sigma-70 family)